MDNQGHASAHSDLHLYGVCDVNVYTNPEGPVTISVGDTCTSVTLYLNDGRHRKRPGVQMLTAIRDAIDAWLADHPAEMAAAAAEEVAA